MIGLLIQKKNSFTPQVSLKIADFFMTKKKAIFINREVSWLFFNHRVLQEAADPATPLIERIKFLGIYSNNLDEFFRVRVATLTRMASFNERQYEGGTFDPKKVLKHVLTIDKQFNAEFEKIYSGIVEELEKHNIFLINEKQLSDSQGEYVKNYFYESVQQHLFPIMLNNIRSLQYLRDKSIYLAVLMKDTKNGLKDNHALIEVPTTAISRFLLLPKVSDKQYIILLDDIIRFCLGDIFINFNYNRFSAYTIKFTRDAELDVDNDVSKSFMERISESLKQRKHGQPVRFIFDKEMPVDFLKIIAKKLHISKEDSLIGGGRYHNFKDFMAFPSFPELKLEYPKLQPLTNKQLESKNSILEVIRQSDVMLHYPYQKFNYLISLLREASINPNVRSIKITLYRLARNSNVINSLINAAKNGKSVKVFIELQARFDEEANIHWVERLQEEGVKILHGIPGLKVHSKLLLIKSKEGNKNISYGYIGTGNFNEQTAKIYTDHALLTTHKDITEDIDKIFDLFEANYKPVRFKELVVSPFSQRTFFLKRINKEIEFAKQGKRAEIIVKLNNLVDEVIVRRLYAASKENVKIKLIVRGICTLMPGIKGLSENIAVISIVDRFLEHSRVMYFYNGGDECFYISSADWMARNFDFRLESTCPIYDKEIQEELRQLLQIQLNDNTKARLITSDTLNPYRTNDIEKEIRSQMEFYNFLKEKSQ